MANIYGYQYRLTKVHRVVDLFFEVNYGATGAPTLVVSPQHSRGVASIVRNSAGNYTVTLQDAYPRMLQLTHTQVVASGNPAAPLMFVVSSTVSSKTLVLQFLASDGSTATDPASGEQSRFALALSNSSLD